MNNAWNRFDYKAVISYTGYAKTRMPDTMKELERVGIEGYETRYGMNNPFEDLAFDSVRHAGNMNYRTNSCTMEHYRAVKTAYETGANQALIMEDDIRFEKDLSILESRIENIPDDYDLAKFEWYFGKKQKPCERIEIAFRKSVAPGWIDGHGVLSVGAACYAMSRTGMKWFIDLVEDAARRPGKGRLRVVDMYHRPWPSDRINIYLANPCAAIQTDSEVCMNEKKKDYRYAAKVREAYGK